MTALPDGQLQISSPVYCHAVHVEDHGWELLSDNWFDLLPGVPVSLRLVEGTAVSALEFSAIDYK